MPGERIIAAQADPVTAARLGWAHLQSEIDCGGDAATIMATFADVDTLSFLPALAGGSRPEVLDSHEMVKDFYRQTFNGMQLDRVQVHCQISGPSYMFLDADFFVTDKGSGASLCVPNLILLPSEPGGVTGELILPHLGTTTAMPSPEDTTRRDRKRWAGIHDDLVREIRTGDMTAAAVRMGQGLAMGMRSPDGTNIHRSGPDDVLAHLQRFAANYQVLDVCVVQLVVGDWYVFSETWWSLGPCGSSKAVRSFSTAQFMPIIGAEESVAVYGVGVEC